MLPSLRAEHVAVDEAWQKTTELHGQLSMGDECLFADSSHCELSPQSDILENLTRSLTFVPGSLSADDVR